MSLWLRHFQYIRRTGFGVKWTSVWNIAWWRRQMETFYTLLALCAENSPATGEFPSQRPVMRSFDVFFDLRLNKLLSKQSRGRLFETLLRSLWRHCNEKETKKNSQTKHVIFFWNPKSMKISTHILTFTLTWKLLNLLRFLTSHSIIYNIVLWFVMSW